MKTRIISLLNVACQRTTVCGEVEEGGAVKATFSSAQVDLYETRFENGYVLVSVCIYLLVV